MNEVTRKLTSIIDLAQTQQLEVVLGDVSDLIVVRCQPSTKEHLAAVAASALEQKLRVKWLNEGTLVAIGVPTKKK